MRPGFGGGVADGGLVGHLALACNRAEAIQDGFEKSGLAAQIRAHKCDTPGTLTFSAVCVHADLPVTNTVRERPSRAEETPSGAAPQVLCSRRFAIMTSGNRSAAAIPGPGPMHLAAIRHKQRKKKRFARAPSA